MAEVVPFPSKFELRAPARVRSVGEVVGWLGRRVVDRDGRGVGRLEGLYVDREHDTPCWLLVSVGRFGTHSLIVPARGAETAGANVRVTADAKTIKSAPRVALSMSPLVASEDRSLARHYREVQRLRDISSKYDHMTTSRPITNFALDELAGPSALPPSAA